MCPKDFLSYFPKQKNPWLVLRVLTCLVVNPVSVTHLAWLGLTNQIHFATQYRQWQALVGRKDLT